jgi:hypothetical protein
MLFDFAVSLVELSEHRLADAEANAPHPQLTSFLWHTHMTPGAHNEPSLFMHVIDVRMYTCHRACGHHKSNSGAGLQVLSHWRSRCSCTLPAGT